MELISTEQVTFNDLYISNFDLILAVSGYESRCTYMVEKIKLQNELKIVLAFEEKPDELFRLENDSKYRQLGFQFIPQSGNKCLDNEYLVHLVADQNKEALNILIDYSCMTKLWYASIINYFIRTDLPCNKVSLYFSYTPSRYTEPKKPKPLKIVEPIGCSAHGIIKGKPLALVIGLGYEKDRAEFLRKAIDPEETYIFYTDPADDQRFTEKVYVNNFRLIDNLHRDCVFSYPVRDLKKVDALLTDLCLDLRLNYKIILAPLGPKPFALCCLILAARYPDIEVWRVSAGTSESIYNREPFGEPLVYRVDFGPEEDY
ncbi:MAG: hypothetical protein AMS27_07165 [Bacteroides sp. SM23_62_1]|nr:MAG: hypothetical protein AMS27_07165 [Bacteroides sp. SM23_62_1]